MRKLTFLLVIILALSPCLPTTFAYDEFDEYDDFDDWTEEYDLDEIDLIDDYFEFEDVFEDYDSFDYLEAAKQKKKEEESKKPYKRYSPSNYKKATPTPTASPIPTPTQVPLMEYDEYKAKQKLSLEPITYNKYWFESFVYVKLKDKTYYLDSSFLESIISFHKYYESYAMLQNFNSITVRGLLNNFHNYKYDWRDFNIDNIPDDHLEFYNIIKHEIDNIPKPDIYDTIDKYFAFGGYIEKEDPYIRSPLAYDERVNNIKEEVDGRTYNVNIWLVVCLSELLEYFDNYVKATTYRNSHSYDYAKVVAAYYPNKYVIDNVQTLRIPIEARDDNAYYGVMMGKILRLVSTIEELGLDYINYKLPPFEKEYYGENMLVIVDYDKELVDIGLMALCEQYEKYFKEYNATPKDVNPDLHNAYQHNLDNVLNADTSNYRDYDLKYYNIFLENINELLNESN